MPDVESWYKYICGMTTVRDQETTHPYTNKSIENQRKSKSEAQHYKKQYYVLRARIQFMTKTFRKALSN